MRKGRLQKLSDTGPGRLGVCAPARKSPDSLSTDPGGAASCHNGGLASGKEQV